MRQFIGPYAGTVPGQQTVSSCTVLVQKGLFTRSAENRDLLLKETYHYFRLNRDEVHGSLPQAQKHWSYELVYGNYSRELLQVLFYNFAKSSFPYAIRFVDFNVLRFMAAFIVSMFLRL
jgi:hypothetical protein